MQRIFLLPCHIGATYRGLTLLALLLLLLSPASGALAQRAPKALPPLDGEIASAALAINNRGEIAGISSATTGFSYADGHTAVVWDRKGTPRVLPPLPGDLHSHATGINLRGEVAGYSGTFDGPFDWTAVRWDRKGVAMVLPPLPGGNGSGATGINAAGEVVGVSLAGDEITAVIWDRDGIPRVLSPLPGTSETVAWAINNRGLAVGWSGERAVIWSRDGIPRALAPPEGHDSSGYYFTASGINWRGEVVGTSEDAEGYLTAVIWDRDGEPRALELPLLEPYPGEFAIYDAFGLGIDPTGEVVGYNMAGFAMLWDRSGTLMTLPSLESGGASQAFAINNRGEIAGYSERYDDELGINTYWAVVWR